MRAPPYGQIPQIIAEDLAQHPRTVWDISVLDETGKPVFTHEAGEAMDAAGLNILSITRAAQVDRIPLDDEIWIEPEDKAEGSGELRPYPPGYNLYTLPFNPEEGHGILRFFPEGYTLPFGEVVHLALSRDDHTAAKMIVRTIGGPHKVNDILSDLSYESGFLRPLQPDDTSPTAPWDYGTTTAPVAARLLQENLRRPAYAKALAHSTFAGGLRRRIELPVNLPDPFPLTALAVKTSYLLEQKRHGTVAHYPAEFLLSDAIKDHGPASVFPNKVGTSYEAGFRHDVARIGGSIIAVLSRSEVPDARGQSASEHHTRKLQARLGRLMHADQP